MSLRPQVPALSARSLPRAYLAERRSRRHTSPQLRRYPVQPLATPGPGEVRVTFLGVSTILVSDGRSAVLTDGFFTRPNLLRALAGTVRSQPQRVRAGLAMAGVKQLDAVFVTHSHFDHALDSAAVAARTGAWLLGSPSTGQIAAGRGFPPERFIPVHEGRPVRFGSFGLTAIGSAHSPGDRLPGQISAPLREPATIKDYKTGHTYSLIVDHEQGSLLVQASAGFIPGALQGRRAQTVYLGIGVLGLQSAEYREQYWRETVEAVGARQVVPVHWDNFTRGLHRHMRPMARPFDDIPASLRWLEQRCAASGVRFVMPRVAEPVDPWGA